MAGETLLRVEDLKLHYRSGRGVVRALDGVSFDVRRNEALVVLGESGCGKSTLAKALMRLLPRNVAHFSGRMLVDGVETMGHSEERFRREVRWVRISLVMQAAMNALNPVVRVGEQVAEPLRVHRGWSNRRALDRAAEVFGLVGVSADFLQRYPFELSGGMRQRVVLAMALVTEPDLVIMDEPTSALDVLTQASIMNALKRIKQELGTSFILITHDVATSSEIAERVALMYAGQLVELADAKDFFREPAHPYSKLLMASVPRLHQAHRPEHIPGEPPSMIDPPTGCRFAERCPDRFARCVENPPPLAIGRTPPGALLALREGNGVMSVAEQAGAVAPGAEEPILSVRDLHTWFELRQWGFIRVGSVKAVDGISFDLRRGESVAFVGESGCGKSSLARTLLGLHLPTRGEVEFEGRSLGELDAAGLKGYRARVGYVQQDPYGALPPFMDVRRILSEPLIVHGVGDKAKREQRAREVLEEVRLSPPDEFLAKFPHMLSGGQQQRVVIARALVLRPTMIIADEPVSMLDASVRVEILNLLRSIQQARNLTLAFITHDLSTVRHFAERIFVMYAGRVIEQSQVDDLLEHPQHPYSEALLAAIADPRPGQCRT
jgi:oligopeptide/dipeptide ABC transporter ATP-binding protein